MNARCVALATLWTQSCQLLESWQLCTLANDVTTELWGPSPIVPQPVRPGG